ncbi:MAG TPA: gluconeogenesis factor YvcK family protein, partial [Rubrobacter sp.]
PPGDVRNCLVALAGRKKLAEVFNYRFEGGGDLSDHSVGNLIIAALADLAGGFCEGVEQAARFLRIKGRVYPAATESLTLMVTHADGTVTRGESVVREAGKAVARVEIEPAGAAAPPGVIAAIEKSDVVILSPGSLFTSTIPALLGAGVKEALASFTGPVVYAANVMTQPGETVGLALSDHLKALAYHVGPVVTDVLVHSGGFPKDLVARYEAEGAAPVEVDREEVGKFGVRLREAVLLADDAGAGLRHDPDRLAGEACEVALVRL